MVRLNMSSHPNRHLADLGFVDLFLQVDLADPQLPQKLRDILTNHIGDDSDVVLTPPGLAPLAVLTVTILHGITGSFPRIQTLVRGDGGFVPGPIWDLNQIRTDARMQRQGMIAL